MTQKTEVDGELVLAASTREGLPTGLYELEEVAAPEGYVLQGKEGRIAVGEDGPFYETEETGMWTPVPSRPVTFAVGIGEGHYDLEDDCWWISVCQANEPVIGKISLKATKEIYETDANGNRTGKTLWIPMPEEKFTLYAQKEIRTMQGEVVYEKDALVDSFITDSEGTAWTGEIMEETGYPEGLYPGVYRLVWEYEDKDSSAVEKERIIEIKYKDAHTPVIYKDEVFRIPLKREEIKEKPEIVPIINPKTGDDLPIGIAVVTMTLSAGFFLAVSYVRKRRSED